MAEFHQVVNALPSGLDSNTAIMRAARMAKLGARAGRFTKLVKLCLAEKISGNLGKIGGNIWDKEMVTMDITPYRW